VAVEEEEEEEEDGWTFLKNFVGEHETTDVNDQLEFRRPQAQVVVMDRRLTLTIS